jgi:hypothetical protein
VVGTIVELSEKIVSTTTIETCNLASAFERMSTPRVVHAMPG